MKKTTKKKTSKANFETYNCSRINEPYLTDEGQAYIELITSDGDCTTLECTLDLYRALMKNNINANSRVDFCFYKSKDTDLVEYVSSTPKNEYRAYQVEYEDSITLPKETVFKNPEE